MSRITTYTCERCKRSSINNNELDLEVVAVGRKEDRYSCGYYSGFNLYSSRVLEAEWCARCREEVGIIEKRDAPISPTPQPTLEDLIKEICQQTIDENKQ